MGIRRPGCPCVSPGVSQAAQFRLPAQLCPAGKKVVRRIPVAQIHLHGWSSPRCPVHKHWLSLTATSPADASAASLSVFNSSWAGLHLSQGNFQKKASSAQLCGHKFSAQHVGNCCRNRTVASGGFPADPVLCRDGSGRDLVLSLRLPIRLQSSHVSGDKPVQGFVQWTKQCWGRWA